jgi:antitoxin VapB
MSLNIKDPSAERLVRELAAATGEGLTLAAELLAIGAHCAALPDLDRRSAEEILGYDEHGQPG